MSIVTKRICSWAAAGAASVLVVGCGGGGSSDAPAASVPPPVAAPVAITTANAPQVAAEAISAAGAGEIGPTFAGLLGVEASGSARPPAPMQALASATRRALAWQAPAVAVGVTVSETLPCSGGGTLTVSGTVASQDRNSAGDRLTLSASACVEAGERLDGSLSITLAEVDANETFYRVALAATRFTTTSGSVGERIDGTLQLVLDDRSPTQTLLAVTSPTFTVVQLLNGTARSSRTLNEFDYRIALTNATGATSETFTFVASGNFGALGDAPVSFRSATTAAIVTPSAAALRPASGAFRVTGAGGSTVVGTVTSTGVRLDIDTNGDAAIDQTRNLTWAEVDQLLGA